jgi:hypothetical protein
VLQTAAAILRPKRASIAKLLCSSLDTDNHSQGFVVSNQASLSLSINSNVNSSVLGRADDRPRILTDTATPEGQAARNIEFRERNYELSQTKERKIPSTSLVR